MTPEKRSTLSLKSADTLVEPENDHSIELAVYDVLLPCRKFKVEHKVSVLGKVSLTAEFILRLAKVIPGISENDVSAFYGFDRREMSFVLSETETPGYIERKDGRIYLTQSGSNLFRDSSAEPAIFSVERRTEDHGFDLISLAPQHLSPLDAFELRLPELEIVDAEKAGSAANGVRRSFKKFYSDVSSRREGPRSEKKELYSIDNVVALDRFQSVLPFIIRAQASTPSKIEADLSSWRPIHEQEDRIEIISAIANFSDSLKVSRREDDQAAYSLLLKLAPDFLKEYERKDGLSVERYYREALTRTGDFQINRPTITTLGSVLLHKNREKFVGGLTHGSVNPNRLPNHLVWIAPQVTNWGASTYLSSMISVVKKHLLQKFNIDEDAFKSVCLVSGQAPHYVDRAFDHVCNSVSTILPRGIEILLVPHIAVVVLVHAPIGAPNGFPAPLGFMSYDRDVLKRTQNMIKDKLSFFNPENGLFNKLSLELTGTE